MKKWILATLTLFTTMLQLYAISDFREGYLINPSNDTIRGYIFYQGLFQDHRVCLFRKELKSKTSAYFPRDLKGYRFINSRYFESREIPNGTEKDTVFMEYLLNGKVSVFSYFDNGAMRYFAKTDDEKLIELKTEKSMVDLNGKKYLKENKKYIGILRALFAESPEIAEQVYNMELTQKDLVRIAHDYHFKVCDGEACIIYEKALKPQNNRFQFGLLTGLTGYRLRPTESNDQATWYWQTSTFKTTYYPSVGVFFRKNLPTIHDHLFFQYEGVFGRDNLLGTKYNYSFQGNSFYDCIHYERDFLQNSFLLKREYDLGKTAISWHGGTFFDYAYRRNYRHTNEEWDTNQDIVGTPTVVDTWNLFGNTNIGLLAGVGITVPIADKFSLMADLRYQIAMGTRHLTPDYTNKDYLTLIVGLAFGK